MISKSSSYQQHHHYNHLNPATLICTIFITLFLITTPLFINAAVLDRFDSTFFTNADYPGEGLYDLSLQFSHNPNRESTPQLIKFSIEPPLGSDVKNIFVKSKEDDRPVPVPLLTETPLGPDGQPLPQIILGSTPLKQNWFQDVVYIRVDFTNLPLTVSAEANWSFIALLCADEVNCYKEVVAKNVFLYQETIYFPKYSSPSEQILTRWQLPQRTNESMFEMVLTNAFFQVSDPSIFRSSLEPNEVDEQIDFFDLKFVGYYSFATTSLERPIMDACFINSIPVGVKPMGGAGRALRIYLSSTLSKDPKAEKVIRQIKINQSRLLHLTCNQVLVLKTDWQSGPYAYSVIKLGHRRETTSQTYEDILYPHLFYRELTPLYSISSTQPPPEVRDVKTEWNSELNLLTQSFILHFNKYSATILVPPNTSIEQTPFKTTDTNPCPSIAQCWDTRQYLLPDTNFTFKSVLDDVVFENELKYTISEKRSKPSKTAFSALFIFPVHGFPVPKLQSQQSNFDPQQQYNTQEQNGMDNNNSYDGNNNIVTNELYTNDLDVLSTNTSQYNYQSSNQQQFQPTQTLPPHLVKKDDYGPLFTYSEVHYEIPTGSPLSFFEFLIRDTGIGDPQFPQNPGNWTKKEQADNTTIGRSTPLSPYPNFATKRLNDLDDLYPVQIFHVQYLPNTTFCSNFPLWMTRLQLESRKDENYLTEDNRLAPSIFSTLNIASYFNVTGIKINPDACYDRPSTTAEGTYNSDFEETKLLKAITEAAARQKTKENQFDEGHYNHNYNTYHVMSVLSNVGVSDDIIQDMNEIVDFISQSWIELGRFIGLIAQDDDNNDYNSIYHHENNELFETIAIQENIDYEAQLRVMEQNEQNNNNIDLNSPDGLQRLLELDIDGDKYPLLSQWQVHERENNIDYQNNKNNNKKIIDNDNNDDLNHIPSHSNSIIQSISTFFTQSFKLFSTVSSKTLHTLNQFNGRYNYNMKNRADDENNISTRLSTQSTQSTFFSLFTTSGNEEDLLDMPIIGTILPIYYYLTGHVKSKDFNYIGGIEDVSTTLSTLLSQYVPSTTSNEESFEQQSLESSLQSAEQIEPLDSQLYNPIQLTLQQKPRSTLFQPLQSSLSNGQVNCEDIGAWIESDISIYSHLVYNRAIILKFSAPQFNSGFDQYTACSLKRTSSSSTLTQLWFDMIEVSIPFGKHRWKQPGSERIDGVRILEPYDTTQPDKLQPRTVVTCTGSFTAVAPGSKAVKHKLKNIAYIYHQENVLRISNLQSEHPLTYYDEIINIELSCDQVDWEEGITADEEMERERAVAEYEWYKKNNLPNPYDNDDDDTINTNNQITSPCRHFHRNLTNIQVIKMLKKQGFVFNEYDIEQDDDNTIRQLSYGLNMESITCGNIWEHIDQNRPKFRVDLRQIDTQTYLSNGSRLLLSYESINPKRNIKIAAIVIPALFGAFIMLIAFCFLARRYDDHRTKTRQQSLKIQTEKIDDDDDDDENNASPDAIQRKEKKRVRTLLAELHKAEGVDYYKDGDDDDDNSNDDEDDIDGDDNNNYNNGDTNNNDNTSNKDTKSSKKNKKQDQQQNQQNAPRQSRYAAVAAAMAEIERQKQKQQDEKLKLSKDEIAQSDSD